MRDGELFSPYVVDLMIREGLRPEGVLLQACCDRSFDDGFEDTYVFLYIDKVAFLTVEYDRVVDSVYNGYVSKKEKILHSRENTPCRRKRFASYRLSEIKKLYLENLIASGVVNIVFEDETKEMLAIATYTNAALSKIAKIARAIEKIKKDGVLNVADFREKEEDLYCPKCGRIYVDKIRKICPKCGSRKSTLKRLLKMGAVYKREIAISLLTLFVCTMLNILAPYVSGTLLLDKSVNHNPDFMNDFWYGKMGLIVIMMLLIGVMSTVFYAFSTIQNTKISQGIVYDMKMKVFESFQKMSMGYFIKNRIGNILQQVTGDSASVANFFTGAIPWILVSVIQFTGGFIMLYHLNWRVILFAVIPVIVIIFVVKATRRHIWRLYQKAYRHGAKTRSVMSDSLQGIKVVKAFGKGENEIDRFDRANKKYLKTNFKLACTSTILGPLYSLILSLVVYGIWIVSGTQIINGDEFMNYGVLATTLSYFTMMLSPIESLSAQIEWWQACMNCAQRLFDLADSEPDVKESNAPIVIDKFAGNIEIKDVSFGYEPNHYVLKNMNAQVNAGEMIGIVGHSGAGKSTLINLITRMYDVNDGAIIIDGYNIKDIAFRTLRDNIALVTQETYIFQGTILENIAYARPEAKREEVIAAAKIANAHDFIELLPEGYDTRVGSGYRSLSGGERQRISIARALLLNPRILILDEATAALDTETEMSIQNALDALTEGRTTLAIAHRLSTLRNADRLIVIEDGEITEIGSHAELVKQKGTYYRLMLKQAEALKAKGI